MNYSNVDTTTPGTSELGYPAVVYKNGNFIQTLVSNQDIENYMQTNRVFCYSSPDKDATLSQIKDCILAETAWFITPQNSVFVVLLNEEDVLKVQIPTNPLPYMRTLRSLAIDSNEKELNMLLEFSSRDQTNETLNQLVFLIQKYSITPLTKYSSVRKKATRLLKTSNTEEYNAVININTLIDKIRTSYPELVNKRAKSTVS